MITEGRYRANRAFLAVSAHLSPPQTAFVGPLYLLSFRYMSSDLPQAHHRRHAPPSPPSQLSLFTMPSARGGGLLESALYCPL